MAKQQPRRRFTLLYDLKGLFGRTFCEEARQQVRVQQGAAGVDQVDIDTIREYGEDRFLFEVEQELRSRHYRGVR